MFEEFVNAYGMEIIGIVLTTILGVVGMVVRRVAQQWLDSSEKKAIAMTAVRFVEQVFKDLHGFEKMQQALDTAAALLKQKGIHFDVNEMKILIEAAVQEFNAQVKPPLLAPETEAAVRKHYEYYTPAEDKLDF